MSTNLDQNEDVLEEEEEDQTNDVRLSVKDLRALRKKARGYDEATAKTAALEREMAFAKAKLDLDDPRIRYFVKGYDGELTSEAIRAMAEKDGFLAASRQEDVPTQEQATHQRFVNASTGADAVSNVKLEDAIRAAGSPEEVLDIMERAGFPTTRTSQ